VLHYKSLSSFNDGNLAAIEVVRRNMIGQDVNLVDLIERGFEDGKVKEK